MHSHIIFDLDGTLVESLPGITNSLNHALQAHQLPTYGEAEVRSFIGNGSFNLCELAAGDDQGAQVESVHAAFMDHYGEHWNSGTIVFDGIHELIAQLKKLGCTLSVLSNKPHAFTTEICKFLFPDDPFACVLGQRDGIEKKPNPSGVHELLGELGQSSNNSILIGDSRVDIFTARNAGIHSIAVTWGYEDAAELQVHKPNWVAQSVEDILTIITPKNTPTYRDSESACL
ncbi:HAD family hydrolase [Rubritalea marina]|uniref:HAD family hydrolase n=1 Tax=Rubritalea marina TaxID=361055 RepID=UPI00036FF7C9|nr:HAD hydrolase-like protein [Rubritalea marina]